MTILDEGDLISPTWRKIRRHYEARLDELRLKNDSTTHDMEATAHIRGGIAEVKRLLELATNEEL